MYWDRMYEVENSSSYPVASIHVYLGTSRLVSKLSILDNPDFLTESGNTFYYHADHLGSSSLITDNKGREYERMAFTPHGEVWQHDTLDSLERIDLLFTGKAMDAETGWYYFGARYLDPRTGMWLSGDPALGEYIPQAPLTQEAKDANGNLPGMGGVYNPVNLALYHYAGNNPIKYVDPDGRSDVNSKDFFAYTMGNNIAGLLKGVRIFSVAGDRGLSLPLGAIFIPTNDDAFQGGYNPNRRNGPSEIGRIGIETHELWHQLQYKATLSLALIPLIIEQAGYDPNSLVGDPYIEGDPKRNPGILSSIKTLWDIPTLEGQAQFVGQWNADVYEYLTGGDVDMERLLQEAKIILESGFSSKAASDILLLNDGEV